MGKFLTLAIAALITAGAAPAKADIQIDIRGLQTSLAMEAAAAGIDWKIGDVASYKIAIGTFIKGTSNNSVGQDVGSSVWMIQDMDLGVMGKQKMEILINRNTGAIEKLLVNGQEQKVPDAGNMEIMETKQANITVPAGTFDCIYAKIKADNQIQEAWINPQAVPLGGNLKVLADSQFGKVNQELVSFKFAQR
jgi:hypothetical protein